MPLRRLSGSLRSRFFLSFLVAFLPVVVLLALSVEIFYVPWLKERSRAELSTSTRVLTQAVRAGASVAVRNHLRAIAEAAREITRQHLRLVDQGLLDRDEALARVEAILLGQKIGTSGYIYCVNSQGRITLHPNAAVQDSNLAAFDFIREQMKRKEGYIEYDWRNPGEPAARAKALYMTYVPELDWIISVSSYRDEFDELLDPADIRDVVLSARFGKTGYAWVVNHDGEVLIHPKLSNYNVLSGEMPADFFTTMLSRGSGSQEYEWRNPGEAEPRRKIAVYEDIPEYGWVVASSAYLDEILHPAVMVRTLAHGSAAALLLAGVLATYLISGRLTRPMDQMVRQLDRNAHSDTPQPLPVLANDELGRLAREFNAYLDVIARQHADLLHEQERYRNLFEASPDAILLVDDQKIVDCNPATATIFGADLDTLIGRSTSDFSSRFQADDTWSLDGTAARVTRDGTTDLQTFEWTCCREDGHRFDAEVRLKLIGTTDGTPRLLVFVRDITRRKQVVGALRRSEEKYRQLVENASDAIVIVQDQRIVFANSRAFEMTGYSPAEMPEDSLQAVVHPDDLSLVIQRHRQRTAGEDGLPSTYTFRMVTRQEATLTVQISVILVDWNGRPATLNFLRDITDQVKMEVALQQAQKMEAIGTLAGGIAHDFNNLLQAVQGHVTLIELDLPAEHAHREHVQAIEDLVDSARHLTQQLLGFARGGKYRPRPVNLNDLVVDSTQLFGRTHKELVIETTTAPKPVVVVADRQQIEQVLLNMYINSGHAMPDGGTLRVAVGVLDVDRLFCEPHGTTPGTYARVSVTDTGIGMDEATCRQVFDPFFTTKHKSRGTGLGLASAYGIIKNHSGFVTVTSEPGRGTTFQIFLPLGEATVSETKPTPPTLHRGHEGILLVDDEPAVTRVGRGLLERLGYNVLVADGCEAAVELMQAHGDRIDLVILDMIMPGLDGRETFERLRALQPDLAVILSSGYALDGRATELMARGCRGFIQKPFRLADLSAEVRRVLAG